MSENNTTQATDTELRDVPADISEYRKFVEDGGLGHNEKVLGREAAVAAAKAAGIETDPAPVIEAEVKKHRNKFQRKVDRLHQAIGARDAEIAELRKSLEARGNGAPKANGAPAVPAEGEGPAKAEAKPAAKDAPARPKEEDFKTYSEFVEALTEWKTDRKLQEREAAREEQRARAANEAEGKKIKAAHDARVDEAKKRYADWGNDSDPGVFKGLTENSFSDAMVVFIFESERGPDVTYYLATHRDELERIRALSPIKQAAALGRIEDRLEAESDKGDKGEDGAGDKGEDAKDAKPPQFAKHEDDENEDDDEPQPKRKSSASKAPPPVKPLGGKGGSSDDMPDPKDFKAYEAWAKRQAAKGIKR
jgi:hypothetical protein